MTGKNGILTRADNAKTETTKAEAREKIQLETAASFDNTGKYNLEKAKKNLEDNLKLVKDAENNGYTEDEDGRLTIKYNGYDIYVDEKGKVGYEKHKIIFNPEALEIGAAVTETKSKYGWKVKDYTVKTTDCPSGVWRLFYQDSKYTYLINDELTRTYYKPSDYYTTIKNKDGELKYQTGADVSIVGQKLSPQISSLFTKDFGNINIKTTAWLTDTSDEGMWAEYKNSDAVFAIGSPTVELFAASYNNTGKLYTITTNFGALGYNDNVGDGWLSAADNYEIYNKSTASNWWLASPGDNYGSRNNGLAVSASSGRLTWDVLFQDSHPVRPVVCIPTSVFNSDYLDSVVDK